ncbi:MAG TPA: hypothetical protein VL992_11805, partial [Tepidisphaeraceae bacterium]|nr:hypothetical protein [Tepidisphaeraceae bacterium]
FTAGLLFTEVFDQGGEEGYLMGQRYYGGKWIYFPLGFLFKEPLASIIGVCLALIVGVHASVRRQLATFQNQWAAICLSVPAGIYALAAITSEMNIGFRHFFPVLPFLYIGTGLAVAAIWRRRAGRIAVVILALALAAETAAAYPDFIAFFNRAAWGQRAWLLSDSNLDWGQDLPALAAWQARNPGVTIYLDFFGHDIPEAYGVHAVDLNDLHGPFRPARPAVAAVSLSLLQLGGYNADALRQLGVDLHSRPIAILGGTICLFAVP